MYQILAITDPGDRVTRLAGFVITGLIILNVLALILETVRSLDETYSWAFRAFGLASIAIFSVEYVLRIWSCTANQKCTRPIVGRLRYAVTPLALVDLLAIAPFYALSLTGVSRVKTTFMRVLRLVRLPRLLKTTRYLQSLSMMGRVLRSKKEQIFVTLAVVVMLIVVLSGVMFLIEREAQPQKLASIPASMWWSVSAMTTVGYGDVYPLTALGKVVGSIIALLGIGVFAVPAGILASGFCEEARGKSGDGGRCPHCGREMDQDPGFFLRKERGPEIRASSLGSRHSTRAICLYSLPSRPLGYRAIAQ